MARRKKTLILVNYRKDSPIARYHARKAKKQGMSIEYI